MAKKNPAVQSGMFPLNGCSKPKARKYQKETMSESKHPSSAMPSIPSTRFKNLALPGKKPATPPLYRGIMGKGK
jgi:hypothetical protein